MILVRRALIAIVFLLVTISAQARNAAVKLTVNASGWDTRLSSLLNKELRGLGDVDLVNEDPDYIIDVIVIEGEFTDGSPADVLTVAVSFLVPLVSLRQTLAIGQCLPETEKKRLRNLSTASGHMKTLAFSTSSPQLPRLAADIVAQFDVTCLEPIRRRSQSR